MVARLLALAHDRDGRDMPDPKRKGEAMSNYDDAIETNFTYHAPRNEGEKAFYEMYREQAKELAMFLNRTARFRPETTLALRKLEEAVMWGNASVARHGLLPDHPEDMKP
jgi:hypothetical protein